MTQTPVPLPEAVQAGHFGCHENGSPVRPCRAEVREITENHAHFLEIALRDRQFEAFEAGIVKYAESFGSATAERLRSYVQHIAAQEVDRPGRG